MLAIRMQRTGRKGHAMFRVVVQDSRVAPTSGKFVALLGSYDPHAKSLRVDKDKATHYLEHGAQPSARTARLLQQEGVTLPGWVKLTQNKARSLRNPEKLRKNRPVEEPAPAEATAAADEPTASDEAAPAASEAPAEEATPESPAEAPVADTKETA